MAHIQLSQTLNLSKPVKLSKPWQTLLVSLANYGMVVAFAACLAYWVWVFLKPNPIAAVPISAPTAQTILPAILAGHWFNNAQAAPIAAAGNINLKLVGIRKGEKLHEEMISAEEWMRTIELENFLITDNILTDDCISYNSYDALMPESEVYQFLTNSNVI